MLFIQPATQLNRKQCEQNSDSKSDPVDNKIKVNAIGLKIHKVQLTDSKPHHRHFQDKGKHVINRGRVKIRLIEAIEQAILVSE